MEQDLRQKVKDAALAYYKSLSKEKKEFSYIPPSGKCIDSDELMNMIDASLDMWLTGGRFQKDFEKEFASYLDVKYAITVNSGSSANLLALTALTSHKLGTGRLQKGDEVITVAAGFPTTVNAIIQNGLIPVFVDTEIGSYNAIVSEVESAITPKTKAVILAHTLGNMFDISKIKTICEKHDLWLIEDSCDALGAVYNGKFAGTIGDIGTFSFYPAHHITMGEGGAVVTNNPLLNKILISFRDWGRDCSCPTGQDGVCGKRFSQQLGNLPFGYDHKYTYSHVGYNLKITDWQASIGLAQLKKLDGFIEKRNMNFDYLYNKLSDLKEYLILPKSQENCKPSWFGFLISVKPCDKFKKQNLVEYLETNGVGTRQLFGGNLLRQPLFVENEIQLKIGNSEILYSNKLTEKEYKLLPNTDFIMNNTFWVGVYPALSEQDLDKISDLIHSYFKED